MSNLVNPYRFVVVGGGPTPSFTWDPLTNGPGTLPGGATFTRASVALEFDGTEYVSKSSGAIRDAHIAFSGGARGYLAEPAATNLLPESSDFLAADWIPGGITPTDDAISPLGLNQWTFDAGTGISIHRIFDSIGNPGGTPSTHFICKEGTGRYFTIRSSEATAYSCFDLQTETITETGGTATGTITSLDDGWAICKINDTAGAGSPMFSISDTSTPGSASPSFTGSNKTILVCHAQCEASRFATSPILTNGSTETRVADVLDSGETIAAAFSALFDFTTPAVIGTGNTISLLGAATSAVDILLLDDTFNVIMDDGGTPTTIGTVAANQRFKVSYGRDGTGRSGSLDGATAVTGDAPASAHEGETFQLYSTASVNQARGVGHLVNLYASRLSDGDLESISS